MTLDFAVEPLDLYQRMLNKEPMTLLDVREPHEWQSLPFQHADKHISLAYLPARFSEMDPEKQTVVVCLHGVRSLRACLFLQDQGFKRILNLKGGIELWNRTNFDMLQSL